MARKLTNADGSPVDVLMALPVGEDGKALPRLPENQRRTLLRLYIQAQEARNIFEIVQKHANQVVEKYNEANVLYRDANGIGANDPIDLETGFITPQESE